MSTLYVSPTGSDLNPGTSALPLFTLNKAWSKAASGDTIFLKNGTYKYKNQQSLLNKNGASGNLIKVWAEPGQIPVITSENYASGDQDLIMFNGNWVHWKGIEIANFSHAQGYNAFRSQAANNCLFELMNIHHNTSSMAIRGDSSGNVVLNSDFHHNANPPDYGGADGLNFSLIPGASTSNKAIGCRAWYNSDDGFDAWGAEGYVSWENCWAMYNGYKEGGFTAAGDGGGFKLGEIQSYPSVLKRTVKNCIAYKNRNWGFNENNLPAGIEILNCTSVGNGKWNYAFGWWGNSNTTLKNNISYKAGGMDGRPDQLEPGKVAMTSNSWQDGRIVTDSDFVSLDDTQLLKPRKSDGSLPDLTFYKTTGVDLAGLGAVFGFTVTPPPPPPVPTTDVVITCLAIEYHVSGTLRPSIEVTKFITVKATGVYNDKGVKRNVINYQVSDSKWKNL